MNNPDILRSDRTSPRGVPLHRFITFQVWAFFTFGGAIVGFIFGGWNGLVAALMIYPWLGLILGVIANELASGHVNRGI